MMNELPPQLTYQEMLALSEKVHNDMRTFGSYVTPEENAKQYLAKSRQTYFTGSIPKKTPTLLDEIRGLLAP